LELFLLVGRAESKFGSIPKSTKGFCISSVSSFSSKFPLLYQYRDKTYGDLINGLISNPFLKTLLAIRSSYALLPPEEISVVGMAGIEMSYFNYGVSCIEGKVEDLPLRLEGALERWKGRS
jgi:hypothetical protein